MFRRTAIGVVAGYGTNALVVAITEAIYSRSMGSSAYLSADLATQTIATVLGGYVCCSIARTNKIPAAASLSVLGLLIGTISLVSSWNSEPRPYGIALLLIYVPCVWAGYALVVRHEARRPGK